MWKRRQLESDLEDELVFHLAMREQKNREAGVAESARRSFGNPELVKEDLRDQCVNGGGRRGHFRGTSVGHSANVQWR
jgi:hypothetical protein